MESLHEKRKKRREAWEKLTDKQKKDHDKDFYQCTHTEFKAASFVDRSEALKIFTDNKFKAEYTNLIKDGTNRWMWTVRDKDYNKIGFILGTPSKDQKQGNHAHNDPFKSEFDYMEINKHESIAG
jgi:hypothetical protein